MDKPLPQLEPFMNCLKSLGVGNYLKSDDFKRYCIRYKLDTNWAGTFQIVQSSRKYFAMGFDHDYFDSIDTMIYILNEMWSQNKLGFYKFSTDILVNYKEWSNNPINIKEFEEDLELLNFPQEFKNMLNKLSIKGVPLVEIPDEIWNSSKLDDYLRKMDDSINSQDYELTLTYAYTCLEGLFKAFICIKSIESSEKDDIVKLSKKVKNHLKEVFSQQKNDFPENMLNLITTISNVIGEARNKFSSSHFNKDSAYWIAEFSRDCVNSVGRLILKFV